MDLSKLNPEQLDAVTTVDGPLLIIAGAGSGKTGVITHRIAYMLEQGIHQSNILALTFTNKAATEMKERIKKLSYSKLSNITVDTFHAFGLQILKANATVLGYKNNFTIYDTIDQIEVLKLAALELKVNFDREELKKINHLFSLIKTSQTALTAQIPLYQQLYQEYEDFLYLKNAFDFDDLIVKPLKLFEDHPEILAHYQKQYKYILVDEFQDTSLIQYQFLHAIGQANHNVCCVGDDDQSIYSWRGANYENLLMFERDYPEHKQIMLERNYRSTGHILKAANSVIANNSNRKDKILWTPDRAHEAAIQVRAQDDAEEESEFISTTIRSLRLSEQRDYKDFGILVRTNTLMPIIEESLMRHNIPYTISGGSSFFARREVKDIIAYMRLIDNFDDDISLLRIINTPRRGVGKKSLELIRSYAKDHHQPLFFTLKKMVYGAEDFFPTATRENLAEFIKMIEKYHETMTYGALMAQYAREMFEEINYWHYLLTDCASEKETKWRYDNVMRLFDFFSNWINNPDNFEPKLNTYLTRITLNNQEDSKDVNADKVSLMTIHAAKGLEFNITFLAGVEEEIIPHARSIAENSANIEEERRLFYVALTRAKEKLFITFCHTRRTNSEQRLCRPSPFLTEIPVHLTETEEKQADDEKAKERIASNLFARFSTPPKEQQR